MVKDEAVNLLKGYKLVDDSEYCQSWNDLREKVVANVQPTDESALQVIGKSAGYEPTQTSSTHTPSIGNTIAGIGELLGDAATDFGSSVGNKIADAASSLGGLFDINSSQIEEPQPALPEKNPKKQKKRGRNV